MPQVEVRDGIEVRASGAIRVWIDGEEFEMRRPRVREFRRLREQLEDVMDTMVVLSEELQATTERMDKEVEERGDEATSEERLTVRKMGRELTARREELLIGWWLDVGKTLCTKSWPTEVDDLPPWMGSTESATELVKHWRSAPSLSGAR